MDLQASSRTTATLGVLALICVLAVAWALHKVTEPFPAAAPAPPLCEETPVSAGDTIQTGQVLVNVLNAGGKSGLAQSTQAKLATYGFTPGKRGNVEHHKRGLTAVVWTAHPKSPAAKLVASYLGHGVKIVRHPSSDYVGITVVVGDAFGKVRQGMASITAPTDTTVCEPTTPNDGLKP